MPPSILDLGRRLRLAPRETIEVPVRLDWTYFGRRLAEDPLTVSFGAQVVFDPLFQADGSVQPGPVGAVADLLEVHRSVPGMTPENLRNAVALRALVDQWEAALARPPLAQRIARHQPPGQPSVPLPGVPLLARGVRYGYCAALDPRCDTGPFYGDNTRDTFIEQAHAIAAALIGGWQRDILWDFAPRAWVGPSGRGRRKKTRLPPAALRRPDARTDTMRLTDLLTPDCVKVPLLATAKEAAIIELVDVLAAGGALSDAAGFKTAVWQRELMRTTGIGHGVAIPHGKSTGCSKLCLAIGKPAVPIDFASVDGKPVDLIFLLASPPDQTGPHIQALANISRMLTDPVLRQAMRAAPTAADLYKLIDAHEAAVPV